MISAGKDYILFRIFSSTFDFHHRSVVSFILISLAVSGLDCAGNRHLIVPTPVPEASFLVTDTFIEQAESLYFEEKFDKAVEILRSVGQQEYSYYRMDEILYWIGKCRYESGDPVRAKRAISMLQKIYPRSNARFPDLVDLKQAVLDSISIHPELYDVPEDETGEDIMVLAGDPEESNANRDGQPVVTNIFYETDIRQALTDVAVQTGVSIVPDNYVSGFVTVEFSGTPLEDALEQLLVPLGLTFRKMDNYYLVGSPSKESPSYVNLTETKHVKPRYLSCEEVKKLLPAVYEDYIRLDPESNMLTITAPAAIIRKFEEDLGKVDNPKTQIMIEAMIVEMSSAATRSLGLDWNFMNRDGEKTYRITKLFPAGLDSTFISEFTRISSAFDIRASIRALATQGKAKIRANPRIATVDGHKAEIRIAKEVYFSLIQGSVNFPYFTLEKITTGVSLTITPHIGESSEITTDIVTEVSDVIGSGEEGLPVTNVRKVNTRIRVMNGETIAIGGLISGRERKETNRVPFIGEIPVIGALFGHTNTLKEETEVMILIIPHILINPMEFEML